MSSGPKQIPLHLPVDAAFDREDLIESPSNATAVAMIDAWPDWPGRIAVLAGPCRFWKIPPGNHMGFPVWCENLRHTGSRRFTG